MFVAAARMWGEKRKPAEALIQVNMALDYDAAYAPAHFLKAQVLIAQTEFGGARAELDDYLQLRPDDREARELRQLCHEAQPDDGERLLALAEVLLRQDALGLSDCLRQEVSKLIQSGEKLLPMLRKRVEAAWPGLGKRLTVEKDGSLRLNLADCGNQVQELSPLQGMPLAELHLNACKRVRDLTPLQGMKLTKLDLGACGQVSDLTPLHGMPLTWLSLWECVQVRDLTPLQGMPLTSLNLAKCQVRDLSPLQGMKLTWLDLGACDQLRNLSPLQGMPIAGLNLMYCHEIHDLTPLQGMKLTWLSVPQCITDTDLTKLQGMQITSLDFSLCNDMHDLRPLKGMPLTSLAFGACGQVRDLTPLQGMPLTSLYLIHCAKVRDLTPLQGMELQEIYFEPKNITKGMDILRQMKSLKTIGIEWERRQQMPAAEFWKKYAGGEFNK